MIGPPFDYIIGVICVVILGFVARTFFTGLRENIVKAVVDSALKRILGDITSGIKEVKEDLKLVKSAQLTAAGTSLLQMQETAAMRQRLEEHLTSDEKFQTEEKDWKLIVSDFIEWSTNFLKTHMHIGAVAEEPPKTPPLVPS